MVILLPHSGCYWYGCKICANLRLGYHRISDDSVTTYAITDLDWPIKYEELMADSDVDQFWVRDFWYDNVIVAENKTN